MFFLKRWYLQWRRRGLDGLAASEFELMKLHRRQASVMARHQIGPMEAYHIAEGNLAQARGDQAKAKALAIAAALEAPAPDGLLDSFGCVDDPFYLCRDSGQPFAETSPVPEQRFPEAT